MSLLFPSYSYENVTYHLLSPRSCSSINSQSLSSCKEFPSFPPYICRDFATLPNLLLEKWDVEGLNPFSLHYPTLSTVGFPLIPSPLTHSSVPSRHSASAQLASESKSDGENEAYFFSFFPPVRHLLFIYCLGHMCIHLLTYTHILTYEHM